MCPSSYSHNSDPKAMTISNVKEEDQDSTVLESVNELHVNLEKILVDDRGNTNVITILSRDHTDRDLVENGSRFPVHC